MTPREAYIASQIKYLGDLDLLEWAVSSECMDEFADDPDVFVILTANRSDPTQIRDITRRFSAFFKRHQPNFDISSAESEKIAHSLFNRRLREYVNERCDPYDVCRMVSPIEDYFNFPNWLGNMYNICDGVQPSVKRRDMVGMLEEVQELLVSD